MLQFFIINLISVDIWMGKDMLHEGMLFSMRLKKGLNSCLNTIIFCFVQGQTMEMMYEIIAQELKSMHLENSHPQDYLNFYCLGNREELPPEVSSSSKPPPCNAEVVMIS